MGQIFVSYSRKDRGFVDDLVRDLSKKGLSCWVDREDISAGRSWRSEIGEAIRQCDGFLIVLSPASVASENVKRELAFAESHGRRIIPLRYQSCTLPAEIELTLGNLQRIDFVEPIYEEAVARLVQSLKPEVQPERKRPKAIWWITAFYFLSGVYYLTGVSLYLLGTPDATGEQTKFFQSLPSFILGIGVVTAILNMAASVALVQRRIQAFHLFLVGWILHTIYSAWVISSISDGEMRVGALVSYGIASSIVYYSYKLKQQKIRKRSPCAENVIQQVKERDSAA